MKLDLIDKKSGRLTVLKESEKKTPHVFWWDCICECGNLVTVRGTLINTGKTNSCGCLARELASKRWIYHGGKGTKLYETWCRMRSRCNNPKNKAYKWYGAIGVSVCKEWDDYSIFRDWALSNGYKEGLQLDKDIKGNGKLYSPETCCWVTSKENNNHRKSNVVITYNGKTMNLKQWADLYKLNRKVMSLRLRQGMSIDEVLKMPLGKRGIYKKRVSYT